MKNLKRKIRYAAFDAHTRLIIISFYIKRFVRHTKHLGLPAALALIGKVYF